MIPYTSLKVVIHNPIKSALKKNGYLHAVKLCDTLQGSIWSSVHPDTKRPVVIKAANKELHQHNKGRVDGIEYDAQEDILKEKSLLKLISTKPNSPNGIVKYLGWFEDDQFYYLVMENGGTSLFEFVVKAHKYIQLGKLEISEWQKFVQLLFKQIVDTIDYMHQHHVAHFDISLENMLINDVSIEIDENDKLHFVMNDKKNPIQIKICDLGLAEYFDNDTNTKCPFRCTKNAGKSNYKSPETRMTGKKAFSAASNDIWCLGVCLFMMLTGCAPFHKAIVSDSLFRSIVNGQIKHVLGLWDRKKFVTKEMMDLLSSIFKYEKKRITMSELKKHSWLR